MYASTKISFVIFQRGLTAMGIALPGVNMSLEVREQELIKWLDALKYAPQTQRNLELIAWFELTLEGVRQQMVAA